MRTGFAALAATLLLAAPAAAQTTDTTPTIAVDGSGTATLLPDIADFQAGVLRRAPTSARARRSANARIAAILKALKARGVADADIQTAGLSIERRRFHHRVRYTAAQTLTIRSRDVKHLGALLDAVANAGADSVEAPEFGFADPSNGQQLAERAALADARKRADAAAAQTGLRITGVRSVDLDPQAGEFAPESTGAGGGSSEKAPRPTRIEPGTQAFSATVRVVYTAAPA
jgi:uncharacterized protein YggE